MRIEWAAEEVIEGMGPEGVSLTSMMPPGKISHQKNGWGCGQDTMVLHLLVRVGRVEPPHFVDPSWSYIVFG